MMHIQLQGKQTPFKLDTGAEVTAIGSDLHVHLGSPTMNTPDKVLFGPSREPLKMLGHFLANMAHKSKTAEQQVLVVEGLKTNLLGLPAIQALHLAVRNSHDFPVFQKLSGIREPG